MGDGDGFGLQRALLSLWSLVTFWSVPLSAVAATGITDTGQPSACALWLAESSVPGIGRGVFAGRDFTEGQILTIAAALGVPKETTGLTQLFNYVYQLSSIQHDGGEPASLLLGPASLINHGEPARINVALTPVSGSHMAVQSTRALKPGEELFTDYGSADWFVARGIPYVETSSEGTREPHPRRTLEDLEANGTCLGILGPDLVKQGILAQQDFPVGHVIESPLFAVPRAAVSSSRVTSHCLGRPGYDVMLLPLSLPGPLLHGRPANVNLSLSLDAPLEGRGVHEFCDAPYLPATVRLTVSRPVKEGERLVVDFQQAWNTPEAPNADFVPVPEGFFPRGWRGRPVQAERVRAAELGDSRAQYQAGEVSRVGLPGAGVEANLTEAAGWYRRAAEQGHARAQLRLATLLHMGKGLQRDVPQAARLYRQAASAGSVLAILLLAELCLEGHEEAGVQANRSAAEEVLGLVASGLRSRLASLGPLFHSLASKFRDGVGGPANLTAAMQWFQAAANAGHTDAQYEVGVAFSSGVGLPEAAILGVAWLGKAAKNGHAGAQLAVGMSYSFGHGVERNESEAFAWYLKAADRGIGRAQYNLAVAYEEGLGVPADPQQAEFWYGKAAENGVHRPEPEPDLPLHSRLLGSAWDLVGQGLALLQSAWPSKRGEL